MLAIVSGIFLAFPFRPEIPLISTVGIEGVVPFGDFMRSFHFYTGQLAFLTLVVHIVESLLSASYEKKTWLSWTLLVASFPVTVFALFSGYVIRGDEIGASAGHIAESLVLEIPFFGSVLNHIILAVTEEGIHRTYMAHICFSFLLLIALMAWHFRLTRLKLEDLAFWAVIAMLPTMFYPPILRPVNPDLSVLGPWFFVGIQELLRHFPPFYAGIIFPAIPILALVFFKKFPRACAMVLIAWHSLYLILSVIGFSR